MQRGHAGARNAAARHGGRSGRARAAGGARCRSAGSATRLSLPLAACTATRKLPGGAWLAGLSSTSVTDPTPASTMFLATCKWTSVSAWRPARMQCGALHPGSSAPRRLGRPARRSVPWSCSACAGTMVSDRRAGGGHSCAPFLLVWSRAHLFCVSTPQMRSCRSYTAACASERAASVVIGAGFVRFMDLGVTVAWNVMPKVGALYTRRRTFSGAAQGAGCGRGWVVTLGRQAARKNAPGSGCKVVP